MDFSVTAGKELQPAESWREVSRNDARFPGKCLEKYKESQAAATNQTNSPPTYTEQTAETPVVKNPHRRPSQICDSKLTRI